MPRDYYFILGIPVGASPAEIKDAYRRLAKEYHPDLYGDKSSPFLAIQEAYSVLGDPERRNAYDRRVRQTGNESEQVRFRPGQSPAPFDVEPLIPEKGPIDLGEASLSRPSRTYNPSFEELLARLLGKFSSSPRPNNVTAVITLTPTQAFCGGHVRLSVPTRLPCPYCSSSGEVGFYECRQCGGEGNVISERPVIINYPASTPNNHVIQLSLDQHGIQNLYLIVHFRICEME